MIDTKKIAVLVLNYNGKEFLQDCIKSVLKQSYKKFDLYLIDNASSDGSVNFVKERFPEAKLIINKKNLGFTGGYNIVLKKLIDKYKYFVLLNNDTIVNTDWLLELIKSVKDSKKTGIATSVVLMRKGSIIDGAGGYFVNLLTGTNCGYLYGEGINTIPQEPFSVFYASGCSMLIKKELLKKIGFLQEEYFAFFEDIDFSWRTLLLGYKIICNPRSIVYHYGSGTAKNSPFANYLCERNRIITYYKNLNCFNFILILPFLILSRLFLSFIYFSSFKHFLAKLKGLASVFYFWTNFREERRKIQSLRKISDKQLFLNNPTFIFSFKQLAKLFFLKKNI